MNIAEASSSVKFYIHPAVGCSPAVGRGVAVVVARSAELRRAEVDRAGPETKSSRRRAEPEQRSPAVAL